MPQGSGIPPLCQKEGVSNMFSRGDTSVCLATRKLSKTVSLQLDNLLDTLLPTHRTWSGEVLFSLPRHSVKTSNSNANHKYVLKSRFFYFLSYGPRYT